MLQFPKVKIFNPLNIFSNKGICNASENNHPLYFDTTHLTLRGADLVIKDLLLVNPPNFYRTKLNSQYKFKRDSNGVNNLFVGWSKPESWGVWSEGEHSSIMFPPIDKGITKLVINARALVNPINPVQALEVSAMGKTYKYFLTSADDNEIVIPLEARDTMTNSPEILEIKFKFLKPVRPKDISSGTDERLLSIGVKSAFFQ